jgi:hypothetical protein
MMQSYSLYEELAETPRQDLLRVTFGKSLIRPGMHMKQLKASSEQLLQK